jgi:hypothetical protein
MISVYRSQGMATWVGAVYSLFRRMNDHNPFLAGLRDAFVLFGSSVYSRPLGSIPKDRPSKLFQTRTRDRILKG